jgi:hypothetical protein
MATMKQVLHGPLPWQQRLSSDEGDAEAPALKVQWSDAATTDDQASNDSTAEEDVNENEDEFLSSESELEQDPTCLNQLAWDEDKPELEICVDPGVYEQQGGPRTLTEIPDVSPEAEIVVQLRADELSPSGVAQQKKRMQV